MNLMRTNKIKKNNINKKSIENISNINILIIFVYNSKLNYHKIKKFNITIIDIIDYR